jgi:CheY-like chemotaxis protein
MAAGSLTGVTVFLAEDDERLRKRVAVVLRRELRVRELTTGEQLLRALTRRGADHRNLVVVADTDLAGDMGGDEACAEALQRLDTMRFVLIIGMSADAGNESLWEGVATWNAFVYKMAHYYRGDGPAALGKRLLSTIRTCRSNSIYRHPDGSYRRELA